MAVEISLNDEAILRLLESPGIDQDISAATAELMQANVNCVMGKLHKATGNRRKLDTADETVFVVELTGGEIGALSHYFRFGLECQRSALKMGDFADDDGPQGT